MRVPRKIKKRQERPFKRRIPQRLRGVPYSLYDFMLKQSGEPFYSMYDARQSAKAMYRMLIKP